MSKFSIGDTVKCINKDNTADDYLEIDKTYTVKKAFCGYVVLENVFGEWLEYRFTKVIESHEPCSIGSPTYTLSFSIDDANGNTVADFLSKSITAKNAQEIITKIIGALA